MKTSKINSQIKKPHLKMIPIKDKRNLTLENLHLAKRGKILKRNWVSSNNRTKQRHHNHVKAKNG